MTISIIITLIVAVFAAAVSHNAFKNRKLLEPIDWFPVLTLTICVLSLTLNIFLPPDAPLRAFTFIIIPLMAFLMRTSSIWEGRPSFRVVMCLCGLQISWFLLNGISLLGVIPVIPDSFCVVMLFLAGVTTAALFAYGLCMRAGSVRKLMESGSVWSMLGLGVDAVYTMALMTMIMSCILVSSQCGRGYDLPAALVCLFAVMMLGALVVRQEQDSLFVLMRSQEDRILESLKISQLEVMAVDRSDTYKDIYGRLVDYFEKEKPFLRHDLTISEVAKAIYSNKLYISRAVSHYTGRNFCQFVNYYRVTYAMEAFRNNMELKITQLSAISGFNSVVSFNMAFKLFMSGNPGEWCRKERTKMSQKKK